MSYYDVLGISSGANAEQIRAAYKQRSQETLMDTEAYDQVQTAYETLTSDSGRAEYDAELLAAATEPVIDSEPPRKGGTVPLRRSSTVTTQLGSSDGVTKALAPVVCPICGQQNSIGDRYCIECGFLLSSTPGPALAQPSPVDAASAPHLESSSGVQYLLHAGLNRVGRESADILVLDKTVSRYHAVVVFDEERHLFSVEDAGSSNGTRVNDYVLPPRSSHQLNNGDEILFGTAKFHLFSGEPAVPAEKTSSADDNGGVSHIEVTLPPVSVSPRARLTLQRGRGPQEVLLVPGTISIGRLPDNQISLPGDRYASGHHAQVVVDDTVFRLIDVGSTNGSYLNGLRLTTNESIAMSDGDELMIGSTVFQFHTIIRPPSDAETSDSIVPTDTEVHFSPPGIDLLGPG
jgi:pSer/pThr/pTyr-binding forkhead associated (FHA) protein